MMGDSSRTQWLGATLVFAVATISVYIMKRKTSNLEAKLRDLHLSLHSSLHKCNAERQGRIRAQQALREALAHPKSGNLELKSYPMAPIATIQSCFSTRNGTPRQPLLVPLARACLVFDTSRVPPACLEGLGEYSHCWIIYVFHLNTNMEKLWKQPSKSKFKAKVRVPSLKGEKKGVFATRSPHRPSPIGLTVAKVESIQGHMVLLSGVDLVDGTPVLDIKPYLPYCDSIEGATVPDWVMVDNLLAVASVSFSDVFSSSLAKCWATAEKSSLYGSADEFQSLIKQVLSWDIRSLSQRTQPHNSLSKSRSCNGVDTTSHSDDEQEGEAACESRNEEATLHSRDIIYHLSLERLNISYRIDLHGNNVVVENVKLLSENSKCSQNRCNYMTWRNKVE